MVPFQTAKTIRNPLILLKYQWTSYTIFLTFLRAQKNTYRQKIKTDDILLYTSVSVIFILVQQMQREEILELIESVVRPLKEKIQHLQKANQELRIQLSSVLPHRVENQRLRSRSREDHMLPKKEQQKEVRTPSIKKKDQKPVWNYGKAPRQENGTYKSPPPVDKNKYKQVAPRVNTRPESKEKNNRASNQKPPIEKKESVQYLSFERQNGEHKKIMGGQKFSEPNSVNGGGSVKEENNLKEHSVVNGKINPQHSNSQVLSSRGGSQLLAEEHNNECQS